MIYSVCYSTTPWLGGFVFRNPEFHSGLFIFNPFRIVKQLKLLTLRAARRPKYPNSQIDTSMKTDQENVRITD
jgi:hypothetical protein